MYRWGGLVGRRARLVLAAALGVVLTAALYGVGVFGHLSDGGFEDPDSESYRAAQAQEEAFPGESVDVVAIYSSERWEAQGAEFRRRVEDTVTALDPDVVQRVVTPYDLPGGGGLVSEDGQAARVLLTLAGDDAEHRSESFEELGTSLAAAGLELEVGGPYAVFEDVNEQVEADITRAESIALPIVFLLSLLVFGTVVAAVMPTLVGVVAVLGAFAVVRALTAVTDVSVFAINVITLLGMGLAIDYALFVVTRFREELAKLPGQGSQHVGTALARTMATAGRTVFFSGVIVAASLSSLLLFPQNFLRSMGYGGMAAVLVAMVASLTVLPAVLGLVGRRIERLRVPLPRRRSRGRHAARPEGAWARIAHSVMRRPVVYLVTISAALLLLASPILSASWGGVDERVLPAGSPSREAAQIQIDRFGGETASADLVVSGADEAELASYAGRVQAVPGVDAVRTVSVTGDGSTALLQAAWSGNGQTEASQRVVRDLREVDTGPGVEVLVGGQSAVTVDLVDSIFDTLPLMALVVAGVMLVLLFIAFGSLVLPVKAIVMNTVSIGAAFGVVTWVFAEGHLEDLLGFTSTGFLDVTQPILMLAILFGLSMDYEVFLLSRIREEWDRTGDNTASVAAGVQRTGAIITGAALLLAVVIGGFATSGITFIKMIGVGMLVAVLLDATVVRVMLVPATMRLLGAANWWAPGPMRRWWERFGHREEPLSRPPAPEAQVLVAAAPESPGPGEADAEVVGGREPALAR